MTQKSSRKLFQRLLILLLGLAFVGSTGYFLIDALFNSASTPQVASTPTDQDLAVQEQGYELALEREPNNPAILQGLVETRLQMNDLQGAVAPLEKLVELYPENAELKALLAVVKEQAQLENPEAREDSPEETPIPSE